jgi:hypothetical protein
MRNTPRQIRANRTITVDFQNEQGLRRSGELE